MHKIALDLGELSKNDFKSFKVNAYRLKVTDKGNFKRHTKETFMTTKFVKSLQNNKNL